MQISHKMGAEAPKKNSGVRGIFPEHALNFRGIVHQVEQLHDHRVYIFLEFNMRGELYSSRELQGNYIKSHISQLAWHMSHSYRILEKNQFRSPVSVSIGHRIPHQVNKILH